MLDGIAVLSDMHLATPYIRFAKHFAEYHSPRRVLPQWSDSAAMLTATHAVSATVH